MKKIVFLYVSFWFICSCGGGGGGNSKENKTYHVAYSVQGLLASTASISYQDLYGQWHKSDVELPWSFTFDAQSGDYVYVSGSSPTLNAVGKYVMKAKHPDLCVGIFLNGIEWKSICCDSDPNVICNFISIDGTLE
jgi:hypothetical protein